MGKRKVILPLPIPHIREEEERSISPSLLIPDSRQVVVDKTIRQDTIIPPKYLEDRKFSYVPGRMWNKVTEFDEFEAEKKKIVKKKLIFEDCESPIKTFVEGWDYVKATLADCECSTKMEPCNNNDECQCARRKASEPPRKVKCGCREKKCQKPWESAQRMFESQN